MDITQAHIDAIRRHIEVLRRMYAPPRRYRAGRNCRKGYNCGGSCINRGYGCRKALQGEAKNFSEWMVNKMSADIGKVVGDAPKDKVKTTKTQRAEPKAEPMSDEMKEGIRIGEEMRKRDEQAKTTPPPAAKKTTKRKAKPKAESKPKAEPKAPAKAVEKPPEPKAKAKPKAEPKAPAAAKPKPPAGKKPKNQKEFNKGVQDRLKSGPVDVLGLQDEMGMDDKQFAKFVNDGIAAGQFNANRKGDSGFNPRKAAQDTFGKDFAQLTGPEKQRLFKQRNDKQKADAERRRRLADAGLPPDKQLIVGGR